jgi:hypothetical protein
MGQGTMTGTSGPSRSTSILSLTSADEHDQQVRNTRLLDGMKALPCAVGTSLGHGAADNRGHEWVSAATSTLGLTSANAQDQQW